MVIKNIAKNKVLRVILSTIGWIFVSLLLLFSLISMIDRLSGFNVSFFGYRASVISSESMSFVHELNKDRIDEDVKLLNVGDIVFSQEYKQFDDIVIGDVVVYNNYKSLVCHRVVDKVIKEEKYYVITQGDANATTDGLVSFDSVKGKVVSVIPKIGYISLYLQSTYGIIGICSVLFIVFVSLFILEILKNKEKKVVLEIKEEDKKDEVKKDN